MHQAPALALTFTASLATNAAAQPSLQVQEGEASAHRLGWSPVLLMPWQDLSPKERERAPQNKLPFNVLPPSDLPPALLPTFVYMVLRV